MEPASWWNRHLGGTGILVEPASWWNRHLGGTGILPVINIPRRTIPTLATRRKIRASPKVVRYGADYPNPGHEAKNKDKSAPNAPYALQPVNLQPSTFNLQPSTFNLQKKTPNRG
ncbi:MAG: hypothetical protein F6J90_06780 [Moorea sp. SIOASIH]|nr:hypothetical protein [Moorena sp. SIOASIH]